MMRVKDAPSSNQRDNLLFSLCSTTAEANDTSTLITEKGCGGR